VSKRFLLSIVRADMGKDVPRYLVRIGPNNKCIGVLYKDKHVTGLFFRRSHWSNWKFSQEGFDAIDLNTGNEYFAINALRGLLRERYEAWGQFGEVLGVIGACHAIYLKGVREG